MSSSIKLLCWNRGLQNREQTLDIWRTYWENLCLKPSLVFLQEEVKTRSSLFSDDHSNYERFFSPVTGKIYSAVIVSNEYRRAKLDYSNLIMHAFLPFLTDNIIKQINNQTTGKELKRILKDHTDYLRAKFDYTLYILRELFYYFPKDKRKDENICLAFGTLIKHWKSWKEQAVDDPFIQFVRKQSRQIDLKDEFGDLLQNTENFRICMVPLSVQGKNIIAVSIHTDKKKMKRIVF